MRPVPTQLVVQAINFICAILAFHICLSRLWFVVSPWSGVSPWIFSALPSLRGLGSTNQPTIGYHAAKDVRLCDIGLPSLKSCLKIPFFSYH